MPARGIRNLLSSRLASVRLISRKSKPDGLSFPRAGDANDLSSEHEARIMRHFSGGVSFTGNQPILSQGLIILGFTNRSGSNMLADYMRQTRQIGGLGEYLNADTAMKQSELRGVDNFADYIASLAGSISQKKPYFGVKASAEQLAFLDRWNITDMFSSVSVVHIRRDDLLAQAVSHWIAQKTGQWTSLQERRSEDVSVDLDRIVQMTRDIARSDEIIRQHCADRSMNYVSLTYEEVTASVQAAMERIGSVTGIVVADHKFHRPKIEKQANDLNAQILRQLRQHLNDRHSSQSGLGLS